MSVPSLTPGEPLLFMGEGFQVHATSHTTGGGFLIAEIASRHGMAIFDEYDPAVLAHR